ncbi:MAG: 5-oxoprolinase subunit PxpA [Lachnospiraceae bacterium]|nr:5-oxoprolinase subunit PxpA [Lachnospiraceae bacterium]
MNSIDLNCDLGESFGAYRIGMDREVIPCITSANVACGFHAGDPVVMEHTVSLCQEYGVAVGAHPGFHDLEGFGRRKIAATPEEMRASIIYQVGALKAFCDAAGIRLHHVKPHGALYNMAGKDYRLARAVAEAVYAVDPELVLLALSGSQMIRAAEEIGLSAASEVFADRAYEADGSLVPRSQPDAMIEDEAEAVARVVRMVTEGKVTARDGSEIPIRADSVCVHGDGEKALAFVKKIGAALRASGIEVRTFV